MIWIWYMPSRYSVFVNWIQESEDAFNEWIAFEQK